MTYRSSHEENTGTSDEQASIGLVVIPSTLIVHAGLRVSNVPADHVFYASAATLVRDRSTGAAFVHANHICEPIPIDDWTLRIKPALMRVIAMTGDKPLDGYLADVRHVSSFQIEDLGLDGNPDIGQIQRLRERFGLDHLLGLLSLSAIGDVDYSGYPELQKAARTTMQGQVDRLTDNIKMPDTAYWLEPTSTEQVPIVRHAKPFAALEGTVIVPGTDLDTHSARSVEDEHPQE